MKITVLGSGSSSGVPLIGNDWGQCDPLDPRNRRTRVSVLVENQGSIIMIDTSPDMRQQVLNCNLKDLNAVLFTHAHADHCHGIDDLRGINYFIKRPIELYADAETMLELETRFPYVFYSENAEHYYRPAVHKHIIDGPFILGKTSIVPYQQDHGHSKSLGFRLNNFAYSTDVHRLDDAAFLVLKDIKVWIVDCVREEPHPTHSHLEQTLEWIARVKPERAFLTHLNHTMDYETLLNKLPDNVWPAYDGLEIEC